jgi:Bacterial protein of unknown function (DUF839)
MNTKTMRVAVVVTAVLAATVAAAVGRDGQAKTSAPALIEGVATGVQVQPLISVGDKIGDYIFESIPDGIAVHKQAGDLSYLYVNHETALVPFPVGFSDYTNAQVSRLAFSKKAADVTAGKIVIPSSANYQRFCSNFLALTKQQGFGRPVLLTNEESSDRINRTGDAYPPGANSEQAGVVVAYDVKNDKYRAVYSLGRYNHENAVAVPGYKVSVILSGDDTFSAPASQLYMYLTHGASGLMNDAGALYGFKSDDAAVNDYGDLASGKTVSGHFIRVPVAVALADQDTLEKWSNDNNVFQFIRVEDIAYDKNQSNIVYFADTGEPRAVADAKTGRLGRGSSTTKGLYPNGRVFKMVLDKKDPRVVQSLQVVIDGDAKGAASAGDVSLIHNPDNVETTKNALLIQEDPGTQNKYAATDTNGTTARIWKYDLKTGALTVVARVNQKALDAKAPQGEWESSGIVDASDAYGAGWFFTNVQAHSVLVTQETRGSTVYKREAGQLLLLKIPGT